MKKKSILTDTQKGILCVIAGVLIQQFNGCFFLWANISSYVLSYMYQFDPTVREEHIFYVDFILIALNVTGYNIGAYLLNNRNWSPKLIVFLGGTISLIGKYMSSTV